MANEEHIEILKQGVEAWNRWRQQNGDTRPDLQGAALSEFELTGINFSRANLGGANLVGATLDKAVMLVATLFNANLGAADLSEANLAGANLSNANLRRAKLARSSLYDAVLTEANLQDADLSEAELRRAYLSGADLSWSNLSSADLRNANLSGSSLRGAKLTRADLQEANLIGADLSMAELEETNLLQVKLGWNTLGNIDLSTVQSLETASHSGPSTIGIDTVVKSKGKIPKVFLRAAGVPENIIGSFRTWSHTEYNSCFISYSSKDQQFVEMLYMDLQKIGVRCWFAPEDMKIGDPFRVRIDESVLQHDKLLLVLSEHSVASPWVEQEVETALERERKQGKTVLFPIRLDDAVMKIKTGWPALVRNTRHIGDFTRWRNHDAYQVAFDRLLRDLKAEGD